jgi:ribosomal protein L18
MKQLLHEPGPDLAWEELRPVLDTAMHELDEADREVILMRYFENRKHADIGERIGLTENAARMRVERALEKLRAALFSRGATATAALAASLSANAVSGAPAGLAATVTTAALVGAAAGVTAAASAVKVAALTTFQKTLVAGMIALIGVAAIYEARRASTLKQKLATLQRRQAPLTRQLSDLALENDRLSNQIARINALEAAGISPQLNSQRNVKAGSTTLVSELELQLREAMKLPDGQRQKRLEEIARAVAIVDIATAVTLAESVLTPESDRRFFQAGLMVRWAETDPQAALDFAMAYAPGKANPDERLAAVTGLLRVWAGKDAGAALAWVEKLPGGFERQNCYAVVLAWLAESDPQRALAQLKDMPVGRERGAVLERIAALLGGKDPAGAAEFGKALPAGSSRDQFLQQVAVAWIAKDPKAAVNFILELPASGLRDDLMRSAVSVWARTDGPAAASFSETLPFNRMWSMTGVGYNWAVSDPAAAWQWSLTIADDETRRSSLGGVLRCLATRSKLDDAANYASQLSGDDQVRAVRSLLIDSSDLDPDWTARWVASFPAGETRNQAVEKLVQHWSEKDPMATANWLAEQPQDAAFQAGARRLIPGMIKASPATAWDWAMVLADPDVKQERLEIVAKSWLGSDTSAARARIQNSGLPVDQVAKLLSPPR